MSGMDQFLAEYYGTNAEAPVVSEEVEKQAQIELFTKLAADNGIDLNQLSDDQVNGLWAEFQGELAKTAEEDKREEDKKKVEEAAKEHEEKKAAAEKFAEADFLGRVMAHSYVNELKKIASEETKEAAGVGDSLKNIGHHVADAFKGKGIGQGYERLQKHKKEVQELKDIASQTRTSGGTEAMHRAIDAETKAKGDKLRSVLGQRVARTGAAYGGAALATGAAAKGIHSAVSGDGKKKKASALDELAAEYALVKAAEAGFDADEAAARLSAVLTLGVSDENSKVAFAQDLSGAVEVRSLELLEQAGYPVQWAE